jgi:hypothetical protein
MAAGADPVALRRTMKEATVLNDEGERRCLFDDVDLAFRVGELPATLDAATAALLERFDVDDRGHVDGAVRLLAGGGQHRPAEIVEVLTYLGVAEPDITAAIATTFGTTEPPTATTTQTSSTPADLDVRDVLRYRVAEHEALIRQIVDEERNPVRVAALATGLGMSYRESVAACAQIGLDPAFTAQVAAARRHGDIAHAAADLAAGWTAPTPPEGWSMYLDAQLGEPPNAAADVVAGTGDDAARAVLAQWRQAATPAPTPAMT